MKPLLLISALLLAGCGENGDLTTAATRSAPSIEGPADVSVIEQAWIDVQVCTGVTAIIAPRVIVHQTDDLYAIASVPQTPGEPIRGFSDGTTAVHLSRSDATSSPLPGFDVGDVARHHMLHFLLYLIGVDNAGNIDHSSVAFDRCG